ncbi:MAG: SCP2 sterol-binding domain-containing protein [Dehalococcoidia bacterium]
MVQEAQRQPETIREVMERMPRVFHSERASGVNSTIQFKFTGAEPGNWVVRIADGQCSVEEGEAENANVTINSPSDVWLKIARREMDGATAFMSGQFTFTGDMGVLMQMGSWFGVG